MGRLAVRLSLAGRNRTASKLAGLGRTPRSPCGEVATRRPPNFGLKTPKVSPARHLHVTIDKSVHILINSQR